MITNVPFIVVSAMRLTNNDVDNMAAHSRLIKEMRRNCILYKEVIGVYDEIEEFSVLIPLNYPLTESLGMELARKYEQDCYLLVDANGLGCLRSKYSPENPLYTSEELGKIQVSRDEPEVDYTKILTNTGSLYFSF